MVNNSIFPCSLEVFRKYGPKRCSVITSSVSGSPNCSRALITEVYRLMQGVKVIETNFYAEVRTHANYNEDVFSNISSKTVITQE